MHIMKSRLVRKVATEKIVKSNFTAFVTHNNHLWSQYRILMGHFYYWHKNFYELQILLPWGTEKQAYLFKGNHKSFQRTSYETCCFC